MCFQQSVSIVVDGTTGVGKTSLIDILAERLALKPYEEIFRDENNLLGKYFTEGSRWCFPMQISFLNNRFSQYQEACQLENAIMDRSIYSDPIFAELYYHTGDMQPEEYFVYKSLFNNLISSLAPPQLVVYLAVSADEAIRRIKLRGRPDELQMPEGYWRSLHEVYTQYYDNFMLAPLLRINADNLDFVHRQEDAALVVDSVANRIKELHLSAG